MRDLGWAGLTLVSLGFGLACGGGARYVNQSSFIPQIAEVTGGGQSANAGTEFSLPVGARVASGSASVWLYGQQVMFKFPDGSIQTAISNAEGWAFLSHPKASATPGTYKIQVANDFLFAGNWFITITSVAAVPSALQVQPGYPPSAPINTMFGGSFRIQAVDAAGAPVAGLAITFASPTTGAGCTFAGGAASVVLTTDSLGMAEPTSITANGFQGGYVISVSGGGLSAGFSVTNL